MGANIIKHEANCKNNSLPSSVTFTGVLVVNKNHVYISSISNELADNNIDHAVIYRWLDGSWAQKTTHVAIRGMVGIESDKFSLLNMGTNGEIVEFTFPGERVEYVDQSPEGPSSLVHLRCMRKIGNAIAVAGMARRVYKRENLKHWVAMDNSVFVPRSQRMESVGFNSIDGTDIEHVYAVGFQGEIWSLNGKHWRKEKSPTSLTLNTVRVFDKNTIYAAGVSGTILKRDDSGWMIVQQNVTTKDFFDISIFHGNVYLSNYDGIFKLDSEGIKQVDLGLNVPVTTAYLDSNDEVIWSVGEKNLVYSEDGITWQEVYLSV